MNRLDLVADCRRCAALCCVLSAFDASEDFAFSKPAGVACPQLRRDGACAIHDQLIPSGLRGCAAYDCHGAGPRATALFAASLLSPRRRHDVFSILGEVHELLWLFTGAADLCPASHADLRAELLDEIDALDELARSPAAGLLAADLGPHRAARRRLLPRLRRAR